MDIKIILDIILGFLLVGTSFYLWMLNKRLGVLRKNRDEMARLIAQFNEATVRADTSIPKLRKAAEDAGQALQDRVEKAQSLRDDLAFMIERADSMADRLENAVRTGRSEMKASPRPAAPAPTATPSSSGLGLGSAAAAGPAAVTSTASAAAPPSASMAASMAASSTASGSTPSPLASPAAQAAITAALQSVKNVAAASRSASSAGAEPMGLRPVVDEEERSEAERELLRALQSVR